MRRCAARLISAALCLFASAASAHAQTTPAPSPTPTPTPRFQYSGKDGNRGFTSNFPAFGSPLRQSVAYFRQYQQMLEYGECAVNVNERYIQSAVANRPMSTSELADFRYVRARTRGCYSSGMAAPTSLLRGALSENLYLAHHAGGLPARLRAVTPERYSAFLRSEQERNGLRDGIERNFAALANCIVVRAPDAVDAVLRTKHGSENERRSMDGALAAASDCAGASSLPQTSNRTYLRANLADSLYQFSDAGGTD